MIVIACRVFPVSYTHLKASAFSAPSSAVASEEEGFSEQESVSEATAEEGAEKAEAFAEETAEAEQEYTGPCVREYHYEEKVKKPKRKQSGNGWKKFIAACLVCSIAGGSAIGVSYSCLLYTSCSARPLHCGHRISKEDLHILPSPICPISFLALPS